MPRQLRFDTIPCVRAAAPSAEARTMASRLMPQIRMGTSSWSFPGWHGLVYDGIYSDAVLAQEGLRAYAQHPLLHCVGVDRAHYGLVPAQVFQSWAAMVPRQFRFVVKAHEACTLHTYPLHARYGSRAGTLNPCFLDADYARDGVVKSYRDGLGDRAGILLFQFARQDIQRLGGTQGFATRLAAFLRALPLGPTYAVEVRNPELLGPDYAIALAQHGAVHCFNVLPGMPSVREQARRLRGVRFHTLVLRWMRHDGIGYEEAVQRYKPFNRLRHPDVQARADITWLCQRAVAAGRDAYVVVNNKAEGSAPLSIERLAESLVERASTNRDGIDGP